MKEKVALILSGWGMRAIFCVWALLALKDTFGISSPDIIIAWSGSAWTASYFVAEQYDYIKKIRLKLLSTKRFINAWRFWKIMDIDYLIDKVFKKQAPLDFEKIYASKIDYYIPMTDGVTWKVEYFSAKAWCDVFELMRATKAIPIIYWKKVRVGSRYYHDGSNSSGVELHIQKAFSLWAQRIIVIHSNTIFPLRLLKLWLFFKSRTFKNWFLQEYCERKQLQKTFRNDKRIISISPKNMHLSVIDNNAGNLKKAFEVWYEQVAHLDTLD